MKFIIYRDKKKQWRWRAVAKNKRIVADSGESYTSKRNCRRSIARLKGMSPLAKVEVRE